MVPAGTMLTLDVKGTAGQWIPRTVAEVRSQVVNALTPNFHVFDVTLDRPSLLSDPENLYYWAWPYTGVVTLQTQEPYGSPTDVASIVAHEFYGAGGSVPTVTVQGYGPQQGKDKETGPGLGSVTAIVVAVAVIVVAFIAYPYLRS